MPNLRHWQKRKLRIKIHWMFLLLWLQLKPFLTYLPQCFLLSLNPVQCWAQQRCSSRVGCPADAGRATVDLQTSNFPIGVFVFQQILNSSWVGESTSNGTGCRQVWAHHRHHWTLFVSNLGYFWAPINEFYYFFFLVHAFLGVDKVTHGGTFKGPGWVGPDAVSAPIWTPKWWMCHSAVRSECETAPTPLG